MENNKKYTVKTVKFSEPQLPKLVETKIKDGAFVLNGNKHSYVKFLLDVYNKSSTHKSMIVKKADLISGHNILIENLNDVDKAKAELWIEEIELHKTLCSASLYYEILGYCFFQIIYNRDKTVNTIKPIDASTIAIGKLKTTEIDSFYFSNDWSKYTSEPNLPVQLPAFDNENIVAGKPQLLMIKRDSPGIVYYAMPSYNQTTINYCLMEFDLSTLLLNQTNHSFSPSAIITHYDLNKTDEEMDAIVEDFQNLYTGTKQTKIVHVWPGDKDLKPSVDFFPTQDDFAKYTETQKTAQRMIAAGHGIVNAELACLPNDAAVIANRSNLQDSFELLLDNLYSTQLMFERELNKVIGINFPGIKIKIQTKSPWQFKAFSENILSQVMTRTELRTELSLPPLQEGELTNLDEVRQKNPDLNNGQLVYPSADSILAQDNANKGETIK